MANNLNIKKQQILTPLLGEKLTLKQRFGNTLKEYGYLSLCFIIPAVIMFLIYLSMEIYPFGEGSVLVLDLNGQYVSFYEGLRNFVYGDRSLIYSFARGLGGEFMGMYAYYLASPLSYIVALFPQSMILEALLVIFLIKTGLCGATFGFYLHQTSREKKSFNRVTVVAFSIMYALAAYCVVYQHNSMWIDAVIWLPLITYGIEELIKKGHYKIYTISLAVSILSNFYIGWMTCIYCAAYFFAYYFMHNEKGRNNPFGEKKHFSKSFLRMVIFSLIAVAISAVIILTAYYSLTLGKTTFSTTKWNFVLKFDILDMFVKFLPGAYDTVRPEGLPFVYCGALTLLLVPVFFCSKRFSTREKALSGIFILFFMLSFVISPVDIIWHGFQEPNWLNYRYSFMLSFFLLTLAYKGFLEIKRTDTKTLAFTSAILILFVGIAQKLDLETFLLGDGTNDRNHELGKLLTIECVWFSILCICVYLIVLCVMRKTKKLQNLSLVLAILVSLEMFANGLVNCLDLGSDVVYTSHTTYHNNLVPLRDTVTVVQDSDKSFYRLEEVSHRKANDNMALNVYGLTGSTSTLNATTIKFIQNMGYVGKSHESRYYAGNAVADSLLGIKYVLSGSSDNSAESTNDKELLDNEKYYSSFYSDDNYTVYKNLYALSLAYAVSSDVYEIDLGDYTNPYDRLNNIITAMLGEDETVEVFKPLDDYRITTTNITVSGVRTAKNAKYPFKHYSKTDESKSGSVHITVSLPYIDTPQDIQDIIEENLDNVDEPLEVSPEVQYLYFYLPSEFHRGFNFSAESGSYGSTYSNGNIRALFLGEIEEGTNTSVTLKLESKELYITQDVPLFYYLDYSVYSEVMEKLAASQLIVDEGFSDDHINGSITTLKDDSTIFTSIPYDKGWIVKVDGKVVETKGILGDSSFEDKSATDGAVVAFDIENAGDHKIELIYRPKALVLGVGVTIAGIIVLLFIIIFEKKINRLMSKRLFPLTIPPISQDEKKSELVQIASPKARNEQMGKGMEPAEPLSAVELEEAEPIEPIESDNLNHNSSEKEED